MHMGRVRGCLLFVVALACLAPGEPLGSLDDDLQKLQGEWVHTHNMKSDYIRTHDRHTVAGEAA